MKAIRGRLPRRILEATLYCRCHPCHTSIAAPFSSRSSKINETEGIADQKHDLEALIRFTSGRWLWNERQQLGCRYVKFDLSALLQLAASVVGSRSCTQVLKISEGQYNKMFQLTMDNGLEIIAKLPNPNAGRPHFTTASEVATMDFEFSWPPCSESDAWSSRASGNPIGAEYILMEKQAGVVLTDVWDLIKGKQKVQGVELMNAFVDDTGCFKHWGGRVSDIDYEQSRKQLGEGVKRFLDREARNDEERREWLKALPFVD